MAEFECLRTKTNKPIKIGRWLMAASQVEDQHYAYDQCLEKLQKMNLFLQFTALTLTYDELFVDHLEKDDRINGVYIEYNLAPVPPIFSKSKLSYRQNELLNNKVHDLLDSGNLKGSWSPWSSPVIPTFINGSLELCIRYDELFDQMKSVFYCDIPEMKAVLDSITESNLFSRITVKDAFHQISLGSRSAQMMAFATDSGSLEFTTLHHGMKDAQVILQYVIQSVLRDIDHRFVKIYLGQVLVHSLDHESHLSVLKKILNCFQTWNVKIDYEKSYFLMDSVIFLGSLINRNGRRTDPKRLLKLRRPMNIRDVRTFLGLASNQKDNIANYEQLTEPLRNLASIVDYYRQPFHWGAEEENALVTLKTELINAEPIPLKRL